MKTNGVHTFVTLQLQPSHQCKMCLARVPECSKKVQSKHMYPFISTHNATTDVYYSEGEISERLFRPFVSGPARFNDIKK